MIALVEEMEYLASGNSKLGEYRGNVEGSLADFRGSVEHLSRPWDAAISMAKPDDGD
jgi:hypothetical protein